MQPVEWCQNCGKCRISGRWVTKERPEEYIVQVCPGCQREGSEYFEGILQLRNPHDDVIEFIYAQINKVRRKGVFITKEKKVKNGIDIYITSQRYLPTLGKRLIAQFGGVIKVNAHLQSRDKQKSKNLYRVNVLYTVPPFILGSLVSWENGIGRVVKIGARSCIVFNFVLQKNALVPYKDIQGEKVHKTLISKIRPNVEVIDPETYQSVPLHTTQALKSGQNINVVIWHHSLYQC